MMCISATEAIEEAYRYGELGLHLLEKFGAIEYLPRTYCAFYGCIYAWKKPVRDTLEPLLRAYRVGLQTGDNEFASLASNIYCMLAIESNVPLDSVLREWTSFRETMVANRQQTSLRLALHHVQAIHHYMGLSPDPLSPKGDLIDEDEALRFSLEHGILMNVLGIWVNRMQVAYVFNDYEQANIMAHVLVKDLWTMPPTVEIISSAFFGSMVALAMAAKGKQFGKNISSAKHTIKKFKKYARCCPRNVLPKLFLIEAELAHVRGDNAGAYEKYTCAIALAKDSDFLFMHALASERTARHFVAQGNLVEAEPYFRRACQSYGAWGGKAKVERLEAEVGSLYGSS
jgi:hypothetical protein